MGPETVCEGREKSLTAYNEYRPEAILVICVSFKATKSLMNYSEECVHCGRCGVTYSVTYASAATAYDRNKRNLCEDTSSRSTEFHGGLRKPFGSIHIFSRNQLSNDRLYLFECNDLSTFQIKNSNIVGTAHLTRKVVYCYPDRPRLILQFNNEDNTYLQCWVKTCVM